MPKPHQPAPDDASAAQPRKRRRGGLFVRDRELRRRICPDLGMDRFKAVLKTWERDGFPKTNALTGGRYWPAVRAWLDSRYGAHEKLFGEDAHDGPENFGNSGRDEDGTTRQGARPQARPHPQGRNTPTLLDGQAGRAQPDGFPRLICPPAARR
jgi:hypothetical protein